MRKIKENVSLKLATWLVVFLFGSMFTGCFTSQTAQSITGYRSDAFYPFAIYRSNIDSSLAIEGDISKRGERKNVHSFLIIPEKVLIEAHLKTKKDVSIEDIASLSPQSRKQLGLRKKLPHGFEKVADVSKGKSRITINERNAVNVDSLFLLPFAFTFDAATAPVQIPLLIGLSIGLSGIN